MARLVDASSSIRVAWDLIKNKQNLQDPCIAKVKVVPAKLIGVVASQGFKQVLVFSAWSSNRAVSKKPLDSPLPACCWQDTWLAKARTAFSMCSGVGTAEAARAVLQHTVNSRPSTLYPMTMDVRTVALWEPRLDLQFSGSGQLEKTCSM